MSSAPKSTGKQSPDQSIAGQEASFDAPGMNLPPLHMDELELLHQFTTETCFTLSDRAESHALWQVTVIQEAFKHPFLMRGILAISALHLSFLRPERHDYYSQLANKNQDAALSAFRPLMTDMDESNSDAFLAMSTLIVVYGFESPKASESLGFFDYKGGHSFGWLPLIKGVYTIIMSVYPWIKNGKLSALLHDQDNGPPTTRLPTVLENQLNDLDTLCNQASGGEEVVQMYKGALASLRECFVRINNRSPHDCEVSIAFLWPVLVPQEFVDQLRASEPLALIILAHYCVILHHLDSYWWMNGWATHIIRKIDRELDDSMRTWLEWATSVVAESERILTNGAPQNSIQGIEISNDFNNTHLDQVLPLPDDELKGFDPATAKSNQL